MLRTVLAASAVVILAGTGLQLAAAGTPRGPDLRGLSPADARAIRGYERWTPLLRSPPADLARLGAAHPGVRRATVNQTRRRLAPRGRQRFPYPVGTTIVKVARQGPDVTLIAIMRKVLRSGATDGGWDWVEYQRPSAAVAFQRVGGGESVCTGCHQLAQQRRRTDWTFLTLR